MEKDSKQITKSQRLVSLDATRGFDMFFIMGGENLLVALVTFFGVQNFHPAFGHVSWEGIHFMDIVFPTFLFLAGVSFPFSVTKSRENGASNLQIAMKAFRRCLFLILLGCLKNGLTYCHFDSMRWWSVLGRIGIAWFGAALIYITFKLRTRILIVLGILIGTTVLTNLLIAPDVATFAKGVTAFATTNPFSPEGNFGCYLDRLVSMGHMYRKFGVDLYDPEGFAGMIPAIATAMLGMFTGELVRSQKFAAGRKCWILLGSAATIFALGYVISPVCPIVKALWTPSFVLVAGGYSMLMFLAFYFMMDVLGFVKWAFPFKVIGMNAITIYMATSVIGFTQARDFFFSGLCQQILPESWTNVRSIVMNLGYVLVCWTFLYFLYRKKTFLKV